jgi:putative pyoverdin transport system ATP-binding/permease protein
MKLFRFLFRYSPRFIALATLIGIGGGLASTAVLAIMNSHLRQVANGEDIGRFFGLCLLILLANMAARLSIAGLSHWSAFDLRLQLGRQWVGTPLIQLERQGSGRMMNAITNDVDRLSESMHILPGLCIDITVIASCLGYLAWLSPWMLVIMVGFIAVALFTRHLPQKKCDRLLAEAHGHGEELVDTFNAIRGGIKELKMNLKRWNGFYAGELYEVSSRYRDKQYRAELIFGLIRGYSEIIYFLFVGLLIYGTPLTGKLSMEVIVGFAVTLLYMKTNIDHVQDSVGQIKRAQIALSNLESLGVFGQKSSMTLAELRLRSSREAVARDVAADARLREHLPTALNSHVRFEGVEFHYQQDNGEHAFGIGPLDLKLRAGELLFVIGGNGSGKTTFAKVLCGLYKPTAGRIIVDDMPVTDENRGWYSQYFGTVFSDGYLFDKLYGTEGLPGDDALVSEYLRELRLQDKVTVSGGRFSTTALSQGQRKRLALVTAYMEDRPLYLFDEWAADQDPEFREFFYHRILPGLKARGKTVVVISHDDRYYHVADRILKFESGRLVVQTSSSSTKPEIAQTFELAALSGA